MDAPKVNLLEYLRSKTQVDLDSFDTEAGLKYKGCADCTSNQYEYYTELNKTKNESVLKKAVKLAASIHEKYPSVTEDELAVEAGAVYLALQMRPFVNGDIHIMVNPRYAYSKERIVEAGKRLHNLFAMTDASFDTSHFVMKVPATWEGLQACHDLKMIDIKTLATTLFTMEQVVLAGEAGCVSISPFLHELKAIFDRRYQDSGPLLKLCYEAQQWYTQAALPTKVKACANIGVDEILQLAGVAALTLVPDDIQVLQGSEMSTAEYPKYLNDEKRYRMDFNRAEDGNAQLKLGQAIHIFCDYQIMAEEVVRVWRSHNST